MKKNEKYFLFSIYIGLIAILAILAYHLSPLDRQIILSKVTVGERTGFDLTKDRLNFGSVSQGQTVSRSIIIDNPFPRDVRIKIKATGTITEGLIASENNFKLEPGEIKNVKFIVTGNSFETYGFYDGKIEVVYYRA